MARFLVLLMRRPTFDQALVPAHRRFLAELRQQGQLELAGPFGDGTGGAYLLRAESLELARHIAHGDPLHVHACSDVSVHAWQAE
ncbi:YciI family protein [Oleiagrimonas sp. C23AA]|uniref:YciI family protein n=1 Tax=Oleiagrimonas sp. C23AA TaxID=2719047 RepID=UPI00142009C3|nr:YciI family protein [Oleiagrimonas sp. C23AA]NII10213.1 hypothetical protein [Oleiagrimonas sp. C23AA]